MSAVGIIPARFASSRFPGKPLAEIAGAPMLQHVAEGARTARRLREVLVATDDQRIAALCERIDLRCVLTRADHASGSDRLAEAAAGLDDEIVVNIQGDEPLIEGFVIDAVVEALEDAGQEASMATAVHAAPDAVLTDPDRVKVVCDTQGNALYFSRAPIPFRRAERSAFQRTGRTERTENAPPVFQHVGLYAYRREFLLRYTKLPPTPLEQSEALEQLRALEHGFRIRCAVIENWESLSVDRPEDIAPVEAALAKRAARGAS